MEKLNRKQSRNIKVEDDEMEKIKLESYLDIEDSRNMKIFQGFEI